MRLVIVDYGMGNLRSVQKAFEKVGAQAHISNDPSFIAQAKMLVLPGVGAFADAIASLRQLRLDRVIKEHVRADRPFLGICLGYQLLFTTSYEDGEHQGLDLFPGRVVPFRTDTPDKVPHMGWNTTRGRFTSGTIFKEVPDEAWFYFVHGYYVEPTISYQIALETEHAGVTFAAGFANGRIFGTQFHPEKSQQLGLSILHRFNTLC